MRIAIDGPSGAGKSTIAKLIAKHYDILYLDTGAMYRAMGLYALRENKNIHDFDEIAQLSEKADIKIAYENGSQVVYLFGENVNGSIRNEEVSMAASAVSAVPAVRLKLVELQREVAASQSVVLDGRDIGTYVLPDAEYKFYITATSEERANRRYKELLAKGQEADYETVLREITERDYNDMHRELTPLRKAEDAVEIDTTNMDIDQVIDYIKGIID